MYRQVVNAASCPKPDLEGFLLIPDRWSALLREPEYVHFKYLCDSKMELWVLQVQNHDPPFKDGLLGTLKLISFSWKKKTTAKILRTKLQFLWIKQQRLHNYIAFCCIYIFLKDIWGTGVHLLSFKVTAVWEQCMICVSAHPEQSAEDASLVQQHWPRTGSVPLCCPFLWQQCARLAVTPQCCAMQPFMATAAPPHPSPSPFTSSRLRGSSPRLPVLLSSVQGSWYHCYGRNHLLSAMVKLLGSLSPKWPWKITPTALTLLFHELPSSWEKPRIFLLRNNPANES